MVIFRQKKINKKPNQIPNFFAKYIQELYSIGGEKMMTNSNT